jgi:hypothetical protein
MNPPTTLGTRARSQATTPREREIEDAMWRGDNAWLANNLPCKCCCEEHTYRDCPARVWSGCMGQDFDFKEDACSS